MFSPCGLRPSFIDPCWGRRSIGIEGLARVFEPLGVCVVSRLRLVRKQRQNCPRSRTFRFQHRLPGWWHNRCSSVELGHESLCSFETLEEAIQDCRRHHEHTGLRSEGNATRDEGPEWSGPRQSKPVGSIAERDGYSAWH